MRPHSYLWPWIKCDLLSSSEALNCELTKYGSQRLEPYKKHSDEEQGHIIHSLPIRVNTNEFSNYPNKKIPLSKSS